MEQRQPVTEQELQSKAVAPRVTQKSLEDNIKATTFYRHGVLTFCVIELKNGFTVTGESACASLENYDKEIGERLAYQMAERKIWPLMGYALREQLQAEADLLTSRAFEEAPDQGVYIGTKVIHARPMDRRSYNNLRGWTLPKGENGDDEGYLVEYTDRLENPAHVAGFAGYVSWSPKDVFEAAYRQVGGTVVA